MRLTSAGYVGIGSTNPQNALDVVGNIKTSGNILVENDGTLNGNVTIGQNLIVKGNLSALKIQNKDINIAI
jgi:hypothetical protein